MIDPSPLLHITAGYGGETALRHLSLHRESTRSLWLREAKAGILAELKGQGELEVIFLSFFFFLLFFRSSLLC